MAFYEEIKGGHFKLNFKLVHHFFYILTSVNRSKGFLMQNSTFYFFPFQKVQLEIWYT